MIKITHTAHEGRMISFPMREAGETITIRKPLDELSKGEREWVRKLTLLPGKQAHLGI